MGKYKVLAVVSWPPPVVGQSLAAKILVDGLRKRGISVDVFSLSKTGRFGILGRVFEVSYTSARVWSSMLSKTRNHKLILYLQIASSTPGMMRDILILQCARLMRIPTVLHIHCHGYRDALDRSPVIVSKLMKNYLYIAEALVVLSEREKKTIQDIVPTEKIHVVPNGVEPLIVEFCKEKQGNTHRLRLPMKILFLSHLHPSKGYIDVIEAARIARDRSLPFQFVIAGEKTPETVEDPNAIIRRYSLRNINYIGPVYGETKMELLSQVDVLILPSYKEVQPIVILEAMFFGLPVVASDIGSISEIFCHDGQRSLLVSPGHPGELIDKLQLLLDKNFYEEVSKTNRRIAFSRYSPDIHVEKMLSVFQSVS